MADKQLKSLQFPGLQDKYLVELTLEELNTLLKDTDVAHEEDLFSGNYKDLNNAPDVDKIILREELEKRLSELNYVTLNDLKNHTEKLEEKFNGNEEEGASETWIIHKAPTFYFKSNIEFISNGITYSSIEYKKDTWSEPEGAVPYDIIYYDTTQVGVSPQGSTAVAYREIDWKDSKYNIIKFTKERPTGDLLKWLQDAGSIKGPNTFQGLFNYVNEQDNNTLNTAKDYVAQAMNNYHAPIANENTLGLVMGGGHGITIDENGRLYATGDIVSEAEILWSKIIEKPTTIEKVSTDPMCQAVINSLPLSSQSGNYSDLNNKPDLSIYALKDEVPEAYVYTLPIASTTTLGGVKIDNSTIGISNGEIYVKNSNAVIWTKWVE